MLALTATVLLVVSCLPWAKPQLFQSLPQCLQDCIDQSEDDNCSVSDIKCLCRASTGNFLPDLVTCMHSNCKKNLDNNLLLTPLQFACEIVGAPIPDLAIQNAEGVGSSLASQVTRTMTMGSLITGGGSSIEITTAVAMVSSSISTVTFTTTEPDGSIVAIAYPVTNWRTTTITGSGLLVTPTLNSAAVSTSEDHVASIVVSSMRSDSTLVLTASLTAAQTSSTDTSTSKSKTTQSIDETNSSPFEDEPSLAVKWEMHHWMIYGILSIWGILSLRGCFH